MYKLHYCANTRKHPPTPQENNYTKKTDTEIQNDQFFLLKGGLFLLQLQCFIAYRSWSLAVFHDIKDYL